MFCWRSNARPFAAAGVEGLCGKVLQDLLRVIGAAEKDAVQPRANAAMGLGCARDHQHAKRRTNGNGGLRAGGEITRERLPEPQRQAHREDEDEDDKAALHYEVASTALEQDGNVHDPMLHHRVGEGERKQEQQNYLGEIQPKGNFGMENFLRERDDYSGRDSDDGAPENHFDLAPVILAGDAEPVAQQGNEPEKNRPVNDDYSGILGDAVGHHREDKG